MKTHLYKVLFNFELKNNLRIYSADNEIYSQLLLYIYFNGTKNLMVTTYNLNEANKLYFNLKNYYDDVYIFPDDDYVTKKAIASSPELLYMRMNLLNNLSSDNLKIVICPINSLFKKLPPYNNYKNLTINLSKNKSFSRRKLTEKLVEIGYKKDTMVTNTGEFSERGFVLDVFPFGEEHPVRIEFFDNEIEKIKYFDEFTQLSIREIDNVEIKPVIDDYNNSGSNILDYLNDPTVVIQDETKILDSINAFREQAKYYGDEENYSLDLLNINNKIIIDKLNNFGTYDVSFNAEEISSYDEKSDAFIKDIIKNNGVLYSTNENFDNKITFKGIKVVNEYLAKGFKYQNKYYYSINDLHKREKIHNYDFKYKLGKRINNVENLSVGDYIVHKSHGIGIYMGISSIAKNSVAKDYILLQYKGKDKLYIPVNKLDKLYKYSSKDGAKPNIQKLNNGEWEKVKARIKSKIKEISGELIKLYRERINATVTPCEEDCIMQKQFELEFPYEETPDQLKSIEDIKKDLESSRPMDRLLCGDVGYGKTEIIFRAVFKAAMNNKQVMYLCPTTLLSQQQFENALKRFKNYGLNIEILNRHVPGSKAKKVLQDLSDGKIDVLFGTHRLLSEDIKPKKLGLLIIDEEQRFGVIHKEKIKKYKKNVHVLSVSATPIPRSLQMSLTGVRDLSLVETAPKNRYSIQTYVIEYDENLIREVILKEVSRNGQVFVLKNRIEGIDRFVAGLKKIIPEVSIEYAHGRMAKEEMQNIMFDFYNNNFNVLVSTTIIENGIDIPNANTIIVIDADRFGLSQLYQIRGRVGRSDRIAYAYLMYDKSSVLTETAVKRLNAIKEFAELGSGYKIAMRDLSIRGAGDMLGTEQAGFIDSVGVDLYLDLINEELNNISDDENEEKVIIDSVDTHIDERYTTEDELIIELHNKINSVDSDEKLKELEDEILDRFGIIDEKVRTYIVQEYTEKLLDKLNIDVFSNDKQKISLKIKDHIYSKLNIEDFFVNATRINNRFSFVYRKNYIIVSLLKTNNKNHYLNYILEILKYIDKKLSKK